MLEIKESLDNLAWTTEHHYAHIAAKHDFIRAVAVQFEIAYTDFRVIQIALQLADKQDLLKRFTSVYHNVYQYESEFVMRGLDAFMDKHENQMVDYRKQKDDLLAVITEIQTGVSLTSKRN